MKKVIAILCSDIHLSEKVPPARSAEPDWLEAQRRPIEELKAVAAEHDAPVLCAGDIFDKWNCSPAIINWAIEHLPTLYAVPGQHDLPHHNLSEIGRSAYDTLVRAGKIYSKSQRPTGGLGNAIALYGFPWGMEIESPGRPSEGILRVAVAHKYVWFDGAGYQRSKGLDHLSSVVKSLKGYDVAVFGDNHQAFVQAVGECNVMNCGCLIRRRSNERDYEPQIGLLYDDGSIGSHKLDTSEDKWADEGPASGGSEPSEALSEFVRELSELSDDSLDFRAAVLCCLKNQKSEVLKSMILDLLEG